MHVLGLLGTIVTILWLLHRLAEMGIDLAGLNPFLWRRRRRWRNNYQANPIFKIDSPLEATALLVTAIAKADGEMSSKEEQAASAQALFRRIAAADGPASEMQRELLERAGEILDRKAAPKGKWEQTAGTQ